MTINWKFWFMYIPPDVEYLNCAKCDYALNGLVQDGWIRCPECGISRYFDPKRTSDPVEKDPNERFPTLLFTLVLLELAAGITASAIHISSIYIFELDRRRGIAPHEALSTAIENLSTTPEYLSVLLAFTIFIVSAKGRRCLLPYLIPIFYLVTEFFLVRLGSA